MILLGGPLFLNSALGGMELGQYELSSDQIALRKLVGPGRYDYRPLTELVRFFIMASLLIWHLRKRLTRSLYSDGNQLGTYEGFWRVSRT